jgi:hypothetical protein
MMKLFDGYRGEIEIVGEPLKQAWHQYRAEAGIAR